MWTACLDQSNHLLYLGCVLMWHIAFVPYSLTSVANCDCMAFFLSCRRVSHDRFRLFTLRSYFEICNAHANIRTRESRRMRRMQCALMEKAKSKKISVHSTGFAVMTRTTTTFDPEFNNRFWDSNARRSTMLKSMGFSLHRHYAKHVIRLVIISTEEKKQKFKCDFFSFTL